jgi:acetyl esterase
MFNERLQKARSRAEYTMVRQVMRLPDPFLYLLSGGRESLGSRTLAPEMQMIAFSERRMKPMHAYPLQQMRRRYRYVTDMMAGYVSFPVFRSDRRIFLDSQAGGRRELAIRLYSPQNGPFPKPVLVYYHGGGWSIGSPDTHDTFCQLLCAEADVLVVSVDYRLAPEHPFPAPLEDCIDAFHWVVENAAEFAGRPDCVVVGGDSAGGNLAAVVAQQTLRRGLTTPQGQLLIYPATDLRRNTASHRECSENFCLTAEWIHWFNGNYIGPHGDITDPRISPALAESFDGLAPAIVVTAGFDPLRDEGEAYAQTLESAGVPVYYEEFPGMLHGFVGMFGVSTEARQACSRIAGALSALVAQR